MPCRIPFQPHMSWADYYFNFIHAKVLLKTRRKVTHNTQPLSQHCPTDRLHARFSLGIACYSSVNKNLMAARAGLEPAQDCSLLSVQQTDSLPLGLPRHITRDFRQSHNMWSLFASREPYNSVISYYHCLQSVVGCHPNRMLPIPQPTRKGYTKDTNLCLATCFYRQSSPNAAACLAHIV